MTRLEGQRVLIIGGGWASVGHVDIATVDVLQQASIDPLFESLGSLDHLILPNSLRSG